MKKVIFVIFFALSFHLASGQAVTSMNFSYWYNPVNEIIFNMNLIRGQNKMILRYKLQENRGMSLNMRLSWDKRDSYFVKAGVPIVEQDSVIQKTITERMGIITFPIPEKPWLLSVKIADGESGKSWNYYKLIEGIYPVDGWVENESGPITENYLNKNKPYRVKSADDQSLFVSYYKQEFFPALPPFVTNEGNPDRFIFHDSLFTINSGAVFTPKKEGLYLFQHDTLAPAGFAYRVFKEKFPKFNRLEDLIPPLEYISTPEEFTSMNRAGNDKSQFDKIILDITGDKDRARSLIRTYFKRVEMSNQYFSSYKEGWKTDRGMIYLIFGEPTEVSRNSGNEIWYYQSIDTRFTFVKIGSVYSPDNYILLRDKNLAQTWYSAIDQWRKSRMD